MIKNLLLVVGLILILSSSLHAQKNVETQNLLWLGYHLKIKLNENWRIRQEIEERTYWFPWRQHQYLLRTNLEWRFAKDWNLAVGGAYFVNTLPQDPIKVKIDNQSELRPQFELANKQVLSSKWNLLHRYWTEFRFFESLEQGGFKFENIRVRYRLELHYKPTSEITLKAFDEIFLNVGNKIVQNVFDQNRYGASIQYMPFPKLGLELGYINLFQQRKSGIDFYNRNILKFTLHHLIQ